MQMMRLIVIPRPKAEESLTLCSTKTRIGQPTLILMERGLRDSSPLRGSE
jgi:hypothetical protein